MHSTAALESEIWDVVHHGPGNQRGSERTDQAARDFLQPLEDMLNRQDTLTRYKTVLHLLGKKPLDAGAQPWQDAALLVWLRNEVVHYKSYWASEIDRKNKIIALRSKKIPAPPFVPPTTIGWFPHACLSAERAAWGVDTCVAFLEAFYHNLGFPSPVARCKSSLGNLLNPRPEIPSS